LAVFMIPTQITQNIAFRERFRATSQLQSKCLLILQIHLILPGLLSS